MRSRRQEKVARVIKEAVSDCIANHLNDPRIEGLISVTKVDVSPDLRNSDVYISVMATDEAAQNKTFNAITHAVKRIQVFVAQALTRTKFCPVIHIKNDDNFKKTLETMRLIDEAVSQYGVAQAPGAPGGGDEEDSETEIEPDEDSPDKIIE